MPPKNEVGVEGGGGVSSFLGNLRLTAVSEMFFLGVKNLFIIWPNI